ncbi:MAG TPA: TonB-dependent receptor [Opitutaceae bacterium]|nr:TonB-dependent receptor [Opitutaceae bacterium]
MKPLPTKLPRRLLGASAGSLLLALSLSAQTPPPNDEVLSLPEFNVTSTTNSGNYTPEGSTAGSRLSAAYKDLPYSVSVLTSDFLKDFSVFELNDELQYMSSLTGADDAGNFNMRGFSGNINLRNGFSSLGVMDISSVDRIEAIKGAAAAVYGQTNPGGLIFVTTKRPPRTSQQQFSQTFGSFKMSQTELSAGGPILGGEKPKLFYLFSANDYYRHYAAPYNESKYTRGGYFALLYRPNDTTNVLFDTNYNKIHNNATTGLPFAVNPAATGQFIGFAYPLTHKEFSSPLDHADRTVYSFDLLVEHRFSEQFSAKIGGNIYRSPRWTYSSFGGGNYNPGTGLIFGRSSTITNGLILGDGRSYILELVAHNYHVGPLEGKTLFTIDDYANMRKDPSFSTNNKVTGISVPSTFNPLAPTYVPYVPWSWSLAGPSTSTTKTWIETRKNNNIVEATGGQIGQEIDWQQLILGLSYRHDYAYSDQRNIIGEVIGGNPNVETKLHTNADTYQVGLTYKVTPDVSAYVGRFGAFVPPSTTVNAGVVPPNQTSIDYEAGIHVDALDHRLTLTADVYTVKRKNESVTVLADPNQPNGPTTTTFLGQTKSQGFEFETDYIFTPALQTKVSYSYTDARILNAGRDLNAVGRPPQGTPRHSLAAIVYWKSPIRGLAFGASLRYLSDAPVVSPTSGAGPVVNGVITTDNGQRELRSPAYGLVDLFASYRWKTGHFNQAVQLAAKNVFDKRYLIINSRNLGDGVSLFLTYSIQH